MILKNRQWCVNLLFRYFLPDATKDLVENEEKLRVLQRSFQLHLGPLGSQQQQDHFGPKKDNNMGTLWSMLSIFQKIEISSGMIHLCFC